MIFKKAVHNFLKVTLIVFIILFTLCVISGKSFFPKIFALNSITKSWTFNISVGSSFTYDTDLISIGSSGASPVSNVNKLLNPSFTSDTTSWTLTPINGDTTPAGWVVVSGDGTYVSANTAWLIMKYEAKCASTSNLGVGLTAPADMTYKVYRDDGTVTPANNCTSANNRAVTSLASGYPVTYIYLSEANTRCNSINIGSTQAHLITNAEWMSVARDVEAQATNWSLGVGGSGYLYAGHNNGQPNWMLQASTNDANKAAYTDATGVTEAQTSATNTANGTSGTTGNQVRTLILSNGSVIWDLSGNAWEWTNNQINGSDKPVGIGSTNTWSGWDTISSWGTLSSALTRPANSTYYPSGYGVGQYYQGKATGGPYGFLRGGNWSDTSPVGVFALALNRSPNTRYGNSGFRCSSGSVAISQSFSSSAGRIGGGNAIAVGNTANALFDGKLVQSVNVGSTVSFDFSAYVYDNTPGNIGGTVSSSVAQLYYNGAGIGATYTNTGSGWWKLSTVITGADASRDFGLLIKAGKTIVVDDFTLSKQGIYSIYTTNAYNHSDVSSWDSFTAVGTGITNNANIYYQICLDDGSSCGYSSGSRWQYYTGGNWTNSTDGTNTSANLAGDLTTTAIQNLSTTSKKISVKAIMVFGGEDVPYLNSFTIGLTDIIAPTISSVSSTPSSSGSTIVWTTHEDSSSKVDYGLTSSYGTTTPETDTSTRVQSHSVILSNLLSCTTYHYRVKSKDASGNEKIDTDNTFTTIGCTGSASVVSQTASTITTTSGGSVSLLSSTTGLGITIPSSFSETDADFQIKQIDKTAAINTTFSPKDYSLVGSYFYDLKALSSISTAITTFDNAITVNISYSSSDNSLVDEKQFRIFRYDGSSWTQLSGCTVNIITKTVSCTTTNFSVFGLFKIDAGSPASTLITYSTTLPPADCTEKPTIGKPDLFEVRTTSTQATLYFTPPPMPYTNFYIAYSTKPNTWEYGTQFDQGYSNGVLKYTISSLSPNTKYYFKVRSGNNCATGEYGNTISIKTTISNTQKIISYKNSTRPLISLSNYLLPVPKKESIAVPVVTNIIPTIVPTSVPVSTPIPTPTPKKKFCIWFLCF